MSLNPNSNCKASYELAASVLFGKGLLVPKYIRHCNNIIGLNLPLNFCVLQITLLFLLKLISYYKSVTSRGLRHFQASASIYE